MASSQSRRYTIYIDNTEAQRELTKMRDRARDLTAEISRIQAAGGNATRQIQQLAATNQNIHALETSISQGLTRSFRDLQNEVRRFENLLHRATDPAQIEQLSNQLNTARQNLLRYEAEVLNVERAQRQLNAQNRTMGQFMTTFLASFAGNVVATFFTRAADAVMEFIGQIGPAISEYQKFLAVLKVGLGNDLAAKAAISQLTNFSSNTPLELNELTESFIKLVNRGFKPTNEELTKLGDLAYSQGKSLDQLVEALLDAQSGEYERLKEFGIRASKANGEVTLSFKGQTVTVKENEKAVRDVILAYGAMEGVAGTMIGVSKTMDGVNSNMSDTIKQLATNVGRLLAPAWLSAKSALTSFIASLVELTKPRGLDEISIEMVELNRTIESLESGMVPLLNRYDELTAKATKLGGETKLSKKEQSELKTIIDSITQQMPSATTEFDNYGNAIKISTDRVREHIAAEKERLKIINKDRIEATKKSIAENEKELASMQERIDQINKTGTFKTTSLSVGIGGTASVSEYKATEEEVNKVIARFKELRGQQMGLKRQLELDTGEYLKEQTKLIDGDKKVAESAVTTDKKTDESRKRAAKQLEEYVNKVTAQKLSGYEREIFESETRYKELYAQLVMYGLDTKKLDETQLQERSLIYQKHFADLASQYGRSRDLLSDTPQARIKRGQSDTTARLMADIDKFAKDNARRNQDDVAAAELAAMNVRGRKQYEARKALLAAQRKQELDNINLTTNERAKIEADYQQKDWDATTDYYAQKVEQYTQYLSSVLSVYEQWSSVQKMREDAELAADKELNDKKKQEYKRQLDAKIISQEDYARKVEALDNAQQAKERALKKKQFERDKVANITKAIMGTAQAVVQMLTAGPIIGQILAAAAAAMGAAQIGIIAAQKAPEYGKGGKLTGPTHDSPSNGLPVYNPETGHPVAYVEGGEGILKRSAMSDGTQYTATGTISQIASMFNSMHGGVNWERGASVKPSWMSFTPKPVNFGAVTSTISNLRTYATGGVFANDTRQKPRHNDANGVSTDPQLQILLTQNMQVLLQLKDQLANGITAIASVNQINNEQQRLETIRSNSTFQP
ncbi:hypothetical protein SAMN05660461_6002 [Chitinophaga ginsengisegetis]|uniref:Phage tail tape measure protein, lambda family n=1 Tax=Chitinophaga ginsengisegetis TaxID=393003 RepID=A0A1T5PBT4_9BACT|nr:hypothetical protein [Chitinophaga ginsengisegetis]SKD10102.1 hypothetical protein SAMN05660461_6002 [Chitinophaga ginsengisegetis]